MSTALDAQQLVFANNPDDQRAFDALEEHYFLGGDWESLADLYRRRIDAPSVAEDPQQLSPVLFRLGQILEERILDPVAAGEVYWRLARLDPTNRPALRQLRGIHEQQQQWDMVLQIAELEGATEMVPYERAVFEAEQGRHWLDHLNDADEAQSAFERSLESDPEYPGALEGLASIHGAAGHPVEAAHYLERLTDRLRGPERAPFWVALGILQAGPLDDTARARQCFERALDDDPFSVAAIEWSLLLETADENWDAVAGLLETRFDVASGARQRAAIAVEASQIQLTQLHSCAAARAWVERASELADEEISVLLARADVDRAEGDTDALVQTLERLISIGGAGIPQTALIQAAELYADLGRGEQAVEALRLASQRTSQDDAALLTLQARLLRDFGSKRELAETLETLTAIDDSQDPSRQAAFLRELARLQEEDLGDEAVAKTHWERAFELEPHDDETLAALERVHRKVHDWEALRALFEAALSVRGKQGQAKLSASLGELLVDRFDDPGAARACFDDAIDDDASCVTALAGLRGLAETAGDKDLLLSVCDRQAALCDDGDEMADLARACIPILKERRAFETALEWARRWRALRPEAVQALEWCADFESLLDQPEAEVASRRALARQQDGRERMETLRRQAALHLRLEDAIAAAAALELALECAPEEVETLTSLAEVYRTLGRAEELAGCLRQWADAVAQEEQTPILEELACLLHDPLGELDSAIVVRWRIVDQPNAPEDASPKLEALLELAGRYTEMAQLFDARRARLGHDSEEAHELDLRRGRLRLDSLGQCEEAAQIFAKLHERRPEDESILGDLERALRTGDDARGLCDLLEKRAGWESDDDRRLSMEFERATLLDEALGEDLAACDVYESIAKEEANSDHAIFAIARLETLLESHGHWARLRDLLASRVEQASGDERVSLRERIAQICREQLGDLAGCAEQLEAIADTATNRVHVWQQLEEIYRHELDRPADWLRVVEAELDTDPEPEREHALRVNAARLLLDEQKRPEGRDAGEAFPHYERVLELDPTQSEAAELLVEHYDQEGEFEKIPGILEARLEHLEEGDAAAGSELHLRLAEVLANHLDDDLSALTHFETARETLGTPPRIAEPLAKLYQAADRFEEMAELSREVLDREDAVFEPVLWRARLAASKRALGQLDEAAMAYRAALLSAPDDRDIEDALMGIYEEQREFEPLAEILEKRLPYASLDEAFDLHMRLARIHADGRNAPAEALGQLEKILDLQPQNRDAFAFAMEVAERVDDPTRLLALLDRLLETELPAPERATLLEKRGRLIADRLDDPEQSLPCFREAIALVPDLDSARLALREQLEGLERWPAVLDCLFVESSKADRERRIELLERAVQIAWEHIRPDAALPWVTRLRQERPDDPSLLERLGEIHRRAGRFEAALRALDEEIGMRPNEEDACRLYVDRARLLERELHSPGRAIVSYQQALAAGKRRDQRDPILIELDRLYALTERAVERATILEERVSSLGAQEGIELRETLATLYCVDLVEHDRAIRPLLINIDATREDPPAQMRHLGALHSVLRASGRPDALARVAERELELIETNDDARQSTPAEYRLHLHEELARIYDNELGNPDRAVLHLREVVEHHEDSDRANARLFDLLRRCGHTAELATRLGVRLETKGGAASEWLELGRLREERMYDLPGAMAAYREACKNDQTVLDALRGLRRCADRLHDFESLANVLELELEQTSRLGAARRAATAHKLGDVCWTQLRSADRAASAYEHALELEPTRLDALQALIRVRETGTDQEETFSLYRREIELLGDDEAHRERARGLWLRLAAGLHSDTRSARPCLEAYEAAASIERLDPADELRLARLHESFGDSDAFIEIFGQWCDRDDSAAGVLEHLELARHLSDIGQPQQARDRARVATQVDPTRPEAWVHLAELERDAEDLDAAADAFAQAAEVADVRWAAEYCVEAAQCVAARDSNRAWEFVNNAIRHDPACFDAHVALTRVAAELGRDRETFEAALHVFEGIERERLSEDVEVEIALLGARAAMRCDEQEAGRRLFAIVVARDPDQIEGLEGIARIDFDAGDYRAARTALEHRIELAGDNPERGLHLSMIARGLEADGLLDAAWTRYEESIEADPDREETHEGLIRVLERSARPEEALGCLERWASCESDASGRACAALRAAEHALALEDPGRAWRNLEVATQLDASLAPAWRLLCEIAGEHGPASDAAALCDLALESIEPGSFSAHISLQAAKLAEIAGETEKAKERYADAASWEPRCAEAALCASRLARQASDWVEADHILARFIEAHPDPESPTLAHVHLERGRLLSGPLEGFEDAIQAYGSALALQPEMHVARTALAGLLMHAPGRARDALGLHEEILATSPMNANSLRAIAKIAEGQRKPEVASAAWTVLDALGLAAPHESAETQRCLPFQIHAKPPLAEAASERLRRIALALREEFSAVLSEVPAPTCEAQDESVAASLLQIQEIEGDMTAPGLMRLDAGERAALFGAVAGLFLDVGGNGGDSPYLEALDRALGRRTRRKVRRLVEETSLAEIEAIDHEAWGLELRALSAAQALDRNGGDLRSTLQAILILEKSSAQDELLGAADVSTLVSSCESARRLLSSITHLLCEKLGPPR